MHSPGPWEYYERLSASENHKGWSIAAIKANGRRVIVGEVYPQYEEEGGPPGKNAEDNARLIAAAPELLAACKEAFEHLMDDLQDYGTEDARPIVEQLRAAIAKAGDVSGRLRGPGDGDDDVTPESGT